MKTKTAEPNCWKGLVLGVAGAGAGLAAMSLYWQVATQVHGSDPRQAENAAGPHTLDEISLIGVHHQPGESSTAATGRLLYEAVTGKEAKKETKSLLSYLVHYGYGLLVGGLYGALRGGSAGVPDVRGGLGYGTGLWLIGSELAQPLLGLSAGPTSAPLSSHAYGLGAHFAFGLATAATTQVLYRVL